MDDDANKAHSPLRIPVPWLFVIAYMAGIVVQFVLPVSIGSSVWVAIAQSLGVVMLTVGAILAVWAQWIFRKVHTTTVPYETPTRLVDWGPYRFTRNPMYLGLFLFFGGISVGFPFVWSIPLLVAVLIYVNAAVVPVEEGHLRENFSEAYHLYCHKVRRWV